MPSYLEENLDNVIHNIKNSKRKKLSVWDIDDTLFSTPSNKMKIVVLDKKTHQPLKRNGKSVTMNSHEFADKETRERIIGNDGVLKEPDSYKVFRDSSVFYKHAIPINENLEHAVKDFNNKQMFFMILTARGNMNDKNLFNEKFKQYGLNMNITDGLRTSHIVRTASVTNLPGGLGKKYVISTILQEIPEINFVSLWDDSQDNINQFNTLKNEFRGRRITFDAHHVKKG